ncbi:MAG TPA: cupin domain-containing protein [Alphaproteobacteria bacterium]|nr:cupin domain-containing protein [Alphaproteobacteria bacterium]
MSSRSLLRLLFSVGILTFATAISLAQDSPVTRTELQRVPIAEMPGREGVLYKAVIAPGGVAAKHSHPGDEFVYVVSGTLVVEPESGGPVTLKAGDSFHQAKGKPHSAHNASTTEPAEAIVFILSEVGQPLASAVE